MARYRKVEHCPIPQSAIVLQSKANGPDLLRFQRTYCAGLPAGVPRSSLGARMKLSLSHRPWPAWPTERD
jgi:hypothetical protein